MSYSTRVIQSGYFNDTLRQWQCQNSHITPLNLMFPIFILWVYHALKSILSVQQFIICMH